MNIINKKIIIIGGGVGGLKLATKLGNNLGYKKKAEIILIDKNINYIWKPFLHKLATGILHEKINSINYAQHAYENYFKFQQGYLTELDYKNKKITLINNSYNNQIVNTITKFELSYDILVISIGSLSNDFNIPGVKEYCLFLDNPNQANCLYKNIINLLSKIYNTNNKNKITNLVIVGGGATGVELSSEIHNMINKSPLYKYKNNNQKINIILIEAGNRILPFLELKISNIIHHKLISLGIKILTNTLITNVDQNGLYTKNNEYIKSKFIIWTAGIKIYNFLKEKFKLETNNINQLIVKSTLQTTYVDNIFAIGDCALCNINSLSTINVPPRAQSANQMASCVYKNILLFLTNNSLINYIYVDYGCLISLSESSVLGILKFNFINNSLFQNKYLIIKGYLAKKIYYILYYKYQFSLHGYIKTIKLIIINKINKIN